MKMSSNINNYIVEYLEFISNYLKIKIQVNIETKENKIKVNLNSDNNSILIGNYGRNLIALNTILKEAIFCKFNEKIDIKIDVNNYMKDKLEKIEKQIDNIISEVLNSHVDTKIYNLNSYQRKIVHEKVKKYDNLKSNSQGENKNRYINIIYIGE